MQGKEQGFSLIELLIVVAIILVICRHRDTEFHAVTNGLERGFRRQLLPHHQ